VQETGAEWVGVAVPVGSPRAIDDLEREADAVIAIQTPADFRAVGQYYRTFGQVSDEEALEYLARES
jgi:predicted phosphoribosyltransferase